MPEPMPIRMDNFFSSLYGTLAQKDYDRRQKSLAESFQRRKQQADYLKEVSNDPKLRPEMRQQLFQTMADVLGHPYDEKGNKLAADSWNSISNVLLGGQQAFYTDQELQDLNFEKYKKQLEEKASIETRIDEDRARRTWKPGQVQERLGENDKPYWSQIFTNGMGDTEERVLGGVPLQIREKEITAKRTSAGQNPHRKVREVMAMLGAKNGVTNIDDLSSDEYQSLAQQAADFMTTKEYLNQDNTKASIAVKNVTTARGGYEVPGVGPYNVIADREYDAARVRLDQINKDYTAYADDKKVKEYIAQQAKASPAFKAMSPDEKKAFLIQKKKEYLDNFPGKAERDALDQKLKARTLGPAPATLPPFPAPDPGRARDFDLQKEIKAREAEAKRAFQNLIGHPDAKKFMK